MTRVSAFSRSISELTRVRQTEGSGFVFIRSVAQDAISDLLEYFPGERLKSPCPYSWNPVPLVFLDVTVPLKVALKVAAGGSHPRCPLTGASRMQAAAMGASTPWSGRGHSDRPSPSVTLSSARQLLAFPVWQYASQPLRAEALSRASPPSVSRDCSSLSGCSDIFRLSTPIYFIQPECPRLSFKSCHFFILFRNQYVSYTSAFKNLAAVSVVPSPAVTPARQHQPPARMGIFASDSGLPHMGRPPQSSPATSPPFKMQLPY